MHQEQVWWFDWFYFNPLPNFYELLCIISDLDNCKINTPDGKCFSFHLRKDNDLLKYLHGLEMPIFCIGLLDFVNFICHFFLLLSLHTLCSFVNLCICIQLNDRLLQFCLKVNSSLKNPVLSKAIFWDRCYQKTSNLDWTFWVYFWQVSQKWNHHQL